MLTFEERARGGGGGGGLAECTVLTLVLHLFLMLCCRMPQRGEERSQNSYTNAAGSDPGSGFSVS